VEVAIAQWYSPVPKTQYPVVVVVVVVVAAQAENHQSAGTAAFFSFFPFHCGISKKCSDISTRRTETSTAGDDVVCQKVNEIEKLSTRAHTPYTIHHIHHIPNNTRTTEPPNHLLFFFF